MLYIYLLSLFAAIYRYKRGASAQARKLFRLFIVVNATNIVMILIHYIGLRYRSGNDIAGIYDNLLFGQYSLPLVLTINLIAVLLNIYVFSTVNSTRK
jgi:formate-dependent nitrite reductase membrane component NrfD